VVGRDLEAHLSFLPKSLDVLLAEVNQCRLAPLLPLSEDVVLDVFDPALVILRDCLLNAFELLSVVELRVQVGHDDVVAKLLALGLGVKPVQPVRQQVIGRTH
jgi:hypothetical protein